MGGGTVFVEAFPFSHRGLAERRVIIATRGCLLAAVLRIRAVVPLVFTTSGGMAPECAAFMKQVALRLADKIRGKTTTLL